MKATDYSAKVLLVLSLFLYFSIHTQTANARDAKGRLIVVIDPGHGGKDAGAIGRKAKEKNIVLNVAKKVGEELKDINPNIVVHYTRSDDRFIELLDRTRFANRKKADLFVSIHANSHKTRSPNGAETFVLGLHRSKENLEVAMKENSAILYEEDRGNKYEDFDPNSTESYIIFEFMQNRHLDASIELAEVVQKGMVSCGLGNRGVKQAGFLVLKGAAMPSILVELGFISNASDEAYMTSTKGSNQLAKKIAESISNYEKALAKRSGVSSTSKDTAREQEKTPEVAPSDEELHYRIQVHADSRVLKSSAPIFKGYEKEVAYYKDGRLYKYTLYNTTSLDEAKKLQKELKGKFKDCFIVGFNKKGEKVSNIY